jgi:hypothetical protein
LLPRFSTRMSTSSVYRSTTSFARQHSRLSMVAAGAAAAGMITAATAAAGAGPWSQAIGNVIKTAQADGSVASGQSTTTAFDAGSVFKLAAPNLAALRHPGAAPVTNGQGTADQVTALHSAGTGGTTSPHATAETPAAFLGAPVVASHPTAHPSAHQAAAPTHKATAAHVVVVQTKPVAKPVAKPQPFLFYDSVTPSALPAGQPAAVYANGSYAASPSQVHGHRSVFWIDTNGSDTKAGVLDVEPGDATPAGAAQWIDAKLSAHPTDIAVIYTMLSDWGQVKADVAGLPSSMQSHVQYWIADPTGYPHLVPGSTATQWYWGNSTDESTALGNFLR